MAPIRSTGCVFPNGQGGIYVNGRAYPVQMKFAVLQARDRLQELDPETVPTFVDIAHEAGVSTFYARKVINEFAVWGRCTDPVFEARARAAKRRGVSVKLRPEVMLFLLALRAEDDQRPLIVYQRILQKEMGVSVSHQTIDAFFKNRFDHRGSLRKSSPIPLDKFRPINIQRYNTFIQTIQRLPDHFRYHFVDEKHVVNSDCMCNRVRADPVTGRIRNIPVSGNFREAYNVIAIISPDPLKPHPVYWVCGQENGTAAAYVAFLERLILNRWFKRGDVLIRDRATIHDRAEARIAEEILWSSIVDGSPLHVLTVPLPARAPELNPIELVFHVLAKRLRSYKYRTERLDDANVPHQVGRVLSELEHELILKCCAWCGY